MVYETFSDNSSANCDLDFRHGICQRSRHPWATNSGGTESTHIAAMGEDLNAQHQQITHTHEGVWAANSGSIQADEAALTSNKPPVQGHPELMPHQG